MKILKEQVKGNYVLNSILVNLPKLTDRSMLEEARCNCRKLFWTSIAPVYLIAQMEFLKVYDWYEEKGLMRFKIKYLLGKTNESLNKMQIYLLQQEEKAKCLEYDFCTKIHQGMEKELLDFKLTCKFYFMRHGLSDCDIKAQVQLAQALINLVCDLYDNILRINKEQYHVDFHKDFPFMDVSNANRYFTQFSDMVIEPKKYNLAVNRNFASIKAFEAIGNKIVDADFIDDASLSALKVNHYEEEVRQIELEKMGVCRLQEKYGK